MPNAADADDILQEVACQIAEKYDEYDSDRPFLPWAIGVAKIKIAEHYRLQNKDVAMYFGDYIESLSEACFRIHSYLHPYSKALDECLKKIDTKGEQLLTYRYQDSMTPQVIADKMNTSSGTIRVMLTRLRNKLKKCMESKVSSNEQL